MGDFFAITERNFPTLRISSRRVSLAASTANLSALADDTIWEKIEGKKHATITHWRVPLCGSVALEPWDAQGIFLE